MGNFFSNTFDDNAPKDHEQEASANSTNLWSASSNDKQPNTIQRFPSPTTNNLSIFTNLVRSEDDDKRRDHDQLIIKQRRDKTFNKSKTTTEGKIIHYNSSQKMLLVGEGDFSFSASLANAFGYATDMVATSLDSQEPPKPMDAAGHGAPGEITRKTSPLSVFVNSEPMKEDQVQYAVKFLPHPKARGSPVMYRRSFLGKKGLSKEEIDKAFRRVPVSQYL